MNTHWYIYAYIDMYRLFMIRWDALVLLCLKTVLWICCGLVFTISFVAFVWWIWYGITFSDSSFFSYTWYFSFFTLFISIWSLKFCSFIKVVSWPMLVEYGNSRFMHNILLVYKHIIYIYIYVCMFIYIFEKMKQFFCKCMWKKHQLSICLGVIFT